MSNATEAQQNRRSMRINLRVDPELDSFLRCAADLEHESLSAFMLGAACERARRTVQQHQQIKVNTEEFHRLLDEIDRPAEVVEPIFKLAERHASQ